MAHETRHSDRIRPDSEYWGTFKLVSDDVAILHANWRLYQQLFGKNAQRVALLNNVAGSFFAQVQGVMLNDVIVAVSRLLDPPRQGKFHNLVLERLLEGVAAGTEGTFGSDLTTSLENLRCKAIPLTELRNKRIAHRDLAVALGCELPVITCHLIGDILSDARDLMNRIQIHLRGSGTAWEHTIMYADGDTLVLALRRSLAFRSLIRDGTLKQIDHDKLPYPDA